MYECIKDTTDDVNAHPTAVTTTKLRHNPLKLMTSAIKVLAYKYNFYKSH